MRSLRLRCAWLALEGLNLAGIADKRRKSLNTRMHAGQNDPFYARGKLRTNHGGGAVYDWGRRQKERTKREKNDELTAGMNAWMDGWMAIALVLLAD